MPYELIRDGEYPGTDLPVFKVYPAGDPKSTSIGEVWAFGVKGVTSTWIPTGVRYQLTCDHAESPVYPIGAYTTAARAMIAKFEGKPTP